MRAVTTLFLTLLLMGLSAPAPTRVLQTGWDVLPIRPEADVASVKRLESLQAAFLNEFGKTNPKIVTPAVVIRRTAILNLALAVVQPGDALAEHLDSYGRLLRGGGQTAQAQTHFDNALAMRLASGRSRPSDFARAYETHARQKLGSKGFERQALRSAQHALDYWRQAQDLRRSWDVSGEDRLYATWDEGALATYMSALWAEASASVPAIPLDLKRKAFDAAQRRLGSSFEAIALDRISARRYAADKGALQRLLAQRDQAFAGIETEGNKFTAAADQRVQAAGANHDALTDPVKQSAGEEAAEAASNRLEQLIRSLSRTIDRDWPQYRAIAFPEPMTIEQTQKLLEPHEAALVMAPTTTGTHIFAITGDRVEWHMASINFFELYPKTRRLLWFAGAAVRATPSEEKEWLASVDGGLNGFDRDTAYALYRQLIEPVEPVLRGKRVVYVAAGDPLQTLPLSILVAAPPTGRDDDPESLRQTRWFGDAVALVGLPSPQLLGSKRVGSSNMAPTQFVGFGDPQLLGEGETRSGRRQRPASSRQANQSSNGGGMLGGSQLADPEVLRRFAKLPGTGNELRSIAALFEPGQAATYLGGDATESRVRSLDLSRFRIIEFATHGLLARELGKDSEPGLVLTPPVVATSEDDGFLTAPEVATLELNADWVILSACNTSGGQDFSSTGLSGLTRAFFVAGARSVLVSHWPVRDDVAAILTANTVRLSEAANHLSRAEALQQAIREVRNTIRYDGLNADGLNETWSHPNAWAPFSLLGQGG